MDFKIRNQADLVLQDFSMMQIRLVSAALDACNRNQAQVCSLEQRQLVFCSVNLSVLHWIDECRGSSNPCMLCGLPRLCLKDNQVMRLL